MSIVLHHATQESAEPKVEDLRIDNAYECPAHKSSNVRIDLGDDTEHSSTAYDSAAERISVVKYGVDEPEGAWWDSWCESFDLLDPNVSSINGKGDDSPQVSNNGPFCMLATLRAQQDTQSPPEVLYVDLQVQGDRDILGVSGMYQLHWERSPINEMP